MQNEAFGQAFGTLGGGVLGPEQAVAAGQLGLPLGVAGEGGQLLVQGRDRVPVVRGQRAQVLDLGGDRP
jgi:hypothetical protein